MTPFLPLAFVAVVIVVLVWGEVLRHRHRPRIAEKWARDYSVVEHGPMLKANRGEGPVTVDPDLLREFVRNEVWAALDRERQRHKEGLP